MINNFILVQIVQTRGASIIKARKLSSAMSAAKAICDHMRTWWFGTTENEYMSMGIITDGSSYGIPEDLVYSYPLTIDSEGNYKIVEGLTINQFSREKMDLSVKELMEERDVALAFLQSS